MWEAGVFQPYLQAPIEGVEGEAKEKRRDYHRGGGAGNREGLDAFQLHLVSPSPVGFLSESL